MKKIGVIAGTPVDTQMGVDYLKKRSSLASVTGGESFEPIYLQAFDNPRDCHLFQIADEAEKEKKITELFKKGLDMGAEEFFIYCNSLSAAVNFNEIAEKLGTKAVTPLNAYAELATKYNKVAVIAANNMATGGIEKAFTDKNPNCYVLGVGLLEMVEMVESKLAPSEIIEKSSLYGLINFFRANGAEALILGCTHFPYFKEALKALPEVMGSFGDQNGAFEIIDPADIMYKLL